MDPRDFINFAKEIVVNFDQVNPKHAEDAHRTSISRIYYGLLHWIQQHFAISVPQSKVKMYHSYVIDQLENLLDDEVLVDFHFVMRSRVEADYFLASSIGIKMFKECEASAQRLLAFIDEETGHVYNEGDELKYYKNFRDGASGGMREPRSKSGVKKSKKGT